MRPVVEALTELRESQVLAELQGMKEQGVPTLEIIRQLQEGMRRVGDRFEAGEYFLSELIMSAEIFKRAIGILGDSLAAAGEERHYGKFIIGTAAGDIHDMGKNLVATVLGCNGFQVIDLGVDVPPDAFLQAIREHHPQVVGLSCLLTTAFDSMKRTIQVVEDAGLRSGLAIIIGGAPVTQATCEYVGADAFCRNANEAVSTAKRLGGGAQ